MISVKEYLKDREIAHPITTEMAVNMADLLSRVNYLFGRLNLRASVSSGYRPVEMNNRIKNAAKASTHTVCKGIDLVDPYGKIGLLLLARQDLLKECGLWLENPRHTVGWVHCDTKERINRVFNP